MILCTLAIFVCTTCLYLIPTSSSFQLLPEYSFKRIRTLNKLERPIDDIIQDGSTMNSSSVIISEDSDAKSEDTVVYQALSVVTRANEEIRSLPLCQLPSPFESDLFTLRIPDDLDGIIPKDGKCEYINDVHLLFHRITLISPNGIGSLSILNFN